MDVEMPVQSMTLHEASSPPPSRSEADLSIQGMGDSGKAVPIGGHRLLRCLTHIMRWSLISTRNHADSSRYPSPKLRRRFKQSREKLEAARKSGDFELVKHWERELAFHGAGHYLHTIFWDIMNPQGGGEPGGELAQQIKKDFGSFDRFKSTSRKRQTKWKAAAGRSSSGVRAPSTGNSTSREASEPLPVGRRTSSGTGCVGARLLPQTSK